MIRRITIRGYKSLRDVTLELQPVTVVLGSTSAGKSNLLELLALLGRTPDDDLPSAFAGIHGDPLHAFTVGNDGPDGIAEFSVDVDIELSAKGLGHVSRGLAAAHRGRALRHPDIWQRFLRYSLTVQMDTDSGRLRVAAESLLALNQDLSVNQHRGAFISTVAGPGEQPRLALKPERQAQTLEHEGGLPRTVASLPHYPPHYPHLTALRHELASWQTYRIEPGRMREDSVLRPLERLPRDGSDIAAFYNTMKHEHPDKFTSMNHAVASALPGIRRADVTVMNDGHVRLHAEEERGEFPASVLSDGTLKALGLIGVAHAPNAGAVVGIEAPEKGLHPERLAWAADMLCGAARHNNAQIIVTTHSAEMAEQFAHRGALLLHCSKTAGATRFEIVRPGWKHAGTGGRGLPKDEGTVEAQCAPGPVVTPVSHVVRVDRRRTIRRTRR